MEDAVARLKKSWKSSRNYRVVYDSLKFVREKLSRSTMAASDAGLCRFRELGGPQCLLRIVQLHSSKTAAVEESNSKILDVAVSILGNCSLDYETRKIVGRMQGIQSIVTILETSMHDTMKAWSLLNRSCRVLANLALDDRLADDILKGGAVKCIVKLLEESSTSTITHSVHDTNLMQSAVRAIRVLAATPARRNSIISHGAAHVLAKLIVSTDEAADEALVICILRAFVVVSVNCSLEFTEQIQSVTSCLERFVKLASSESESYRIPALNVLANLSRQASMRPLLGNAGAIDCLVHCLGGSWETSSPSLQWAIDALCQCTRESVNRVKVREHAGGLGLLVRLLREPLQGRLWRCGLSALINFFYDDVSFSRLVDGEKMVEALLQKFSALAACEKMVEHDQFWRNSGCSAITSLMPLNDAPLVDAAAASPTTFSPSSLSGFTRDRHPHTCSFSPENSPPYWTSFSNLPSMSPSNSCSPPPRYQIMLSPSALSPHRDAFSPEPACDMEEFCYSPVYESEDESDEEEGKAKSSENSVASESTSQTVSPVSDSQREIATDVDHSAESRSPIGDILFLLSKLSLEEQPRQHFLCPATLDALVEYTLTVEYPHPRAKRILNRIARNPLCFERLVILRWVVSLKTRLTTATLHSPHECAACESLDAFGFTLLNDLKLQAESPFGVGVLLHMLLTGRTSEEKVSALMTTLHLVRIPRILHKILFLEADGMAQMISILMDSCHVDHELVFHEFVNFAQEIVFPLDDQISANCGGLITTTTTSNKCHYEDTFSDDHHDDDNDDLVRLTVESEADGHKLLAHKSVLGDACDVFGAMFNGNFAESHRSDVVIGNASFEALQYVVHRIYSCDVNCPAVSNLSEKILLECLVLADKLLMLGLKKTVCDSLMSLVHRLPSTEVYVHTKVYDCPELLRWTVSQMLSPKFPVEQRKDVLKKMMSTEFGLQDVFQRLSETILTNAKL